MAGGMGGPVPKGHGPCLPHGHMDATLLSTPSRKAEGYKDSLNRGLGTTLGAGICRLG